MTEGTIIVGGLIIIVLAGLTCWLRDRHVEKLPAPG